MRSELILALAPYIDRTLTAEAAQAIVMQFPVRGTPINLDQFAPVHSGGLEFRAERARDILPELHRMHEEHWKETEGYRAGIPMQPDYERGIALEQDGGLIQFTARRDGALVGNIRMYLSKSMHTQQPMATEDTVYLVPAERGGFKALRFLQYMESCLFRLGVREIQMDDKVSNPSAGRLLEFLKYEHVANRRHKVLTEESIHVRT